MWAQKVKNTIENFPPSNEIFFLRPRRRRCHRRHHRLVAVGRRSLLRSLSVAQEEHCEKSPLAGGGGSEKNLNVIPRADDSWCYPASFHHQNKTTEHQEQQTHREDYYPWTSSSPLPWWSLYPIIGFTPNKSVATIVEGFNRGSVGSAREPLWMEV